MTESAALNWVWGLVVFFLAALSALGALPVGPQIVLAGGGSGAESRVGAFEADLGDRVGGQGSDSAANALGSVRDSWEVASGYLVAARGGARAGDVLPTPNVSSTKLQNIADDLYRGTGNPNRVGNGTTADAIPIRAPDGEFGGWQVPHTEGPGVCPRARQLPDEQPERAVP